jgi:hypothetical protein
MVKYRCAELTERATKSLFDGEGRMKSILGGLRKAQTFLTDNAEKLGIKGAARKILDKGREWGLWQQGHGITTLGLNDRK